MRLITIFRDVDFDRDAALDAAPCEESETRYLLDPIDDDDVSLIAFDEEGKVIPAPGASN